MEIGAIAHIGEHMLLGGERRLAGPQHALAAHVRNGHGVLRAGQHGDGMAADAGQRAAAVRQLGGAVVRTPRAECRQAHRPED
ncbi:hypothetical protein SDC9_144805 [bioreactor metagenome]|uniref:Uncharacterized protein n=1 Tax=bioreactor metagenome TaxID=1076179 RepID=A0A645E7B1_9ZZZZ